MAGDRAHVDLVRDEVQKLLAQSSAYQAMPPAERKRFEDHMVQVSAYLADPKLAEARRTTARALADQQKEPSATDQLQGRLAQKQGQIGAEFQAGAMRQGVEEFGNLVQKVDFPAFVSGLVQGVFRAIVDASMQQMQAYGELLSATAKSVDQFADDHISDAQARDHVANRFPSLLQVDTSGEGPATLRLRDGADPALLAEHFGEMADLDSEASELKLVNQAKLQMAASKQQNLAMMVLMGINRIVVTDGKINAKVVFDINASDTAKRTAKAQMHDERSSSSTEAGFTGWFLGAGAAVSSQDHKTTVGSAVDDTSESKAQMKAQLSGDVHINFKSETFPLEKMVDLIGMQAINAKAAPQPVGPRGVPPVAAPAPAPAAAPPPPAQGARP